MEGARRARGLGVASLVVLTIAAALSAGRGATTTRAIEGLLVALMAIAVVRPVVVLIRREWQAIADDEISSEIESRWRSE